MKLHVLLSSLLFASCGRSYDAEMPPAPSSVVQSDEPSEKMVAPEESSLRKEESKAEASPEAPPPPPAAGAFDDGNGAEAGDLQRMEPLSAPKGDANAAPAQPAGKLSDEAGTLSLFLGQGRGEDGEGYLDTPGVKDRPDMSGLAVTGSSERSRKQVILEAIAIEAEQADPASGGEHIDGVGRRTAPSDPAPDGKERDAIGGRWRDLDLVARGATIPSHAGDSAYEPPETTLPRVFYFENTYLGGSAAYRERLRRLDEALSADARHHELVRAEAQPFDPPGSEGLGLSASLDVTHFDRARRVFLQIGIQGSSRYGWRRPPLDLVLVVDGPALAQGQAFLSDFVAGLLRQLGPADRLGLVVAGQPRPFLELSRLGSAQQHLAARIGELGGATSAPSSLPDAMAAAGAMLSAASDDEAIVPGSQTVLVLTAGESSPALVGAERAAHALTLQGAVTSVFALGSTHGDWWRVANSGHGNLHRIDDASFEDAQGAEMASLARVVARLARLNVRLGRGVKAIRVLGTRVLEQREVEDLKAREVAVDRNLSRTLGITSDRGEDDDGIQTVIPYFYGDDSHVILIELWVENPGPIAEVTLRYKDMVNLDNATARTSVRLDPRPRPETREQVLIARNVRGALLAESLQTASDAIERNDAPTAVRNLIDASNMAAETNDLDQRAVDGLRTLVERGAWQGDARTRAILREQLLISGQRRVGDTAKDPR